MRHPPPVDWSPVTPTDAGSAPPPPGNRPRLLADLADLVGLPVTGPAEGTAVQGVTLASAEVRPGDLYAALPGARTHGVEYLADAAARGAVAVLTDPTGRERALASDLPVCVVDDPRAVLGPVADRVYGEPSRRLTVVGITGTNGKTTTAYLVEAGLAAAGLGTGLIGTVQTRTRGRDDAGRPRSPRSRASARRRRPPPCTRCSRRWPRPVSPPWSWRSPATRW